MKKTAVMFDLDGTLLDTLEDLGDSMNATLREWHAPEHDYAFYRQAVGDGARMLVMRSLPERLHDAATVDEAMAAMRRRYAANWNVKTRVYEGVGELVQALRARGVVMAVLSNKPDADLRRCVRHFFPAEPFAVVRGVVPNGPIKPDPTAALAIVRELGIPEEQWVYVGDTNTDMRTAVSAGLFAVGCLWGFRDRSELLASGADTIIDRPADLLRFL